jgi:phosphoglycolate phosphatase
MPTSPREPVLVFDLDGTLIDSAPGILRAFGAALHGRGIQPALALRPEIVGPPLRETLKLLAPRADAAEIDALAEAFKLAYDSSGLFESRVFDGVAAMLAELAAAGTRMFIVTNKRIAPTRAIVAHLGWSGYFEALYALDAFAPPLPDKAATLDRLLRDFDLARAAAIYVGDRREDGLAAQANGVRFVHARWGYGTPATELDVPTWRSAAHANAAVFAPD